MQRFVKPFCQPQKKMKTCIVLLLLCFSFFACKKESSDRVIGTVKQSAGCFATSWLVTIENPDPDKHSFICKETILAGTAYNCSNAVFITNLPDKLAVSGKKIRFSVRNVQPYSCLSYNLAPYHIEAENVSEVP